jgi:lipopolysaccharide export system permease protein
MKILTRYLLEELLAPLGAWIAFIVLLLFVLQFLRGSEVVLGSAATPLDILRMMVFLAPHLLVMALPIAFLLAILLSLGRLSEDRELLVLAALGFRPTQLVFVPVLAGLIAGGALFLLASTGVPWGLRHVRSQAAELIKKNFAEGVKPGVFSEDLTQLTLYAEQVDEVEGQWTNVLIHDDRDPRAPLLVLAHRGQVHPAKGKGLQLSLQSGQVHRAGGSEREYALLGFERAEFAIGLEETMSRQSKRFRLPKEEMTPVQLLHAADDAQAAGRNPVSYRLAFHWRFAQALCPLAFALWATPLAWGTQRSGRSRAFLYTLLGYICYYVLWRAFEHLSGRGHLPPLLAAQLPNMLFAAKGILSLRQGQKGTR